MVKEMSSYESAINRLYGLYLMVHFNYYVESNQSEFINKIKHIFLRNTSN